MDAAGAKALIMAEICPLIEEDLAVVIRSEGGTHELRLATRESFHLGDATVTRTA